MIGVFDSGFGGLTVLRQLVNDLPDYKYIYFGDNARAPYGSKSQETIYSYTKEGVDFLLNQGCELIIIACNTASSEALRRIQQEHLPKLNSNIRVLGVLIPVAEILAAEAKEIIQKHYEPKVALIGTVATINSRSYEKEISKLLPKFELLSLSTPLLTPLVEEGWVNKRVTKIVLRSYLKKLKTPFYDYLILGCTHYPFLEKQIRGIINRKTKIINTPLSVSIKLREYLNNHVEIKKNLVQSREVIIYTSDDLKSFVNFFNNHFSKEFKNKSLTFKSLK